MDIFNCRCCCHSYSVDHSELPGDQSGGGKPGEEFKNGIKPIGKVQLGNFEIAISQSQKLKVNFNV
jgi:hypothetical protein